jgi:hypothetical protein
MRTLRTVAASGLATALLGGSLVLSPQALAAARYDSRTHLDATHRWNQVVTLVADVDVVGVRGDRERRLLRGGDVRFSWRRDDHGRRGSDWRWLGSDRLDRNGEASVRVRVHSSGRIEFRAAFSGTDDVRRSSDTTTVWVRGGGGGRP